MFVTHVWYNMINNSEVTQANPKEEIYIEKKMNKCSSVHVTQTRTAHGMPWNGIEMLHNLKKVYYSQKCKDQRSGIRRDDEYQGFTSW